MHHKPREVAITKAVIIKIRGLPCYNCIFIFEVRYQMTRIIVLKIQFLDITAKIKIFSDILFLSPKIKWKKSMDDRVSLH